MPVRLLHLLLGALLFFPAGACPCHLLEPHACAEDQATDPETDAPADEHHPDYPQHEDGPCHDCLARQTTNGQFTAQARVAAPDHASPAAASLDLPGIPPLDPGHTFTLFRCSFPRDGTPLYLKVRALLL